MIQIKFASRFVCAISFYTHFYIKSNFGNLGAPKKDPNKTTSLCRLNVCYREPNVYAFYPSAYMREPLQYQTKNQKQTPTPCTILLFIRNDHRGCCNDTGRVPPAADRINTATRECNDATSLCKGDACSRQTRRVRRPTSASARFSECVGECVGDIQ